MPEQLLALVPCPRCGDLAVPGTTACAACGSRLFLTSPGPEAIDPAEARRRQEVFVQRVQERHRQNGGAGGLATVRDCARKWPSITESHKLAQERIATVPETINGPLTRRQREILALLMEGMSNADVAAELSIAMETVKSQLRNMLERTGAKNRLQLAVWAARKNQRGDSVSGPGAVAS